MDKQTAIKHIINGNLEVVDKKFLTTHILLEKEAPEGYYINAQSQPLIFEIIRRGQIPNLPKKLLNKSLLTHEVGYAQKTVLHEIASHGYLYCLPKGRLTKEALLAPDSIGNTCLYYGCETGEVSIMPKSIINASNLEKKNQRERNCMHQLSKSGNLGRIPQTLINEQSMLGQNPKKTDPIDEFYTYCTGVVKSHEPVIRMMEGFSNNGLIYLTKKEYILSHMATQLLKKRKAEAISKLINRNSKEWTIPN